jgi:cyanophycin synthetase
MFIIITFIIIIFIFYLVNNILKKSIFENYQGFITDSFFEELNKKNYEIDYDNRTITYNGNTISYNKHFNTNEAIVNAKNKFITSTILSENNIPIPKYMKIDFTKPINLEEIQLLIKDKGIKYPVVLKPTNGTFGIDVFTDIDTKEELKSTLNFLKDKYKDVILEEQIKGDCYRIFVFNNQVIDIIKREKPYIIGDGKHTIKELIEIRNEEQLKMDLLPIKNISEIVVKKQGYSLEDIPEYNEKIFISNVINMHNGARISRIPLDAVPKKNIDLFIKVNKAMKINCSGLDYLSEDITIDYALNNSKILEVNGTPDTEIHRKLTDLNFFEKVVDSIFGNNT